MGRFTKWLTSGPTATFDDYILYRDKIKKVGLTGEERPLAGVHAAVEKGEDLQRRVTLSRFLALGIFSLAAKKTTGGEWWLLIEGPDFAWTVEVDRKKQEAARRFAAAVNTAAKSVSDDG